jgi:hypothetical protein
MNPHNTLERRLACDFLIPDPGNGGVIECSKDGGLVEIVTTAAETRTVRAPLRSGLTLRIAMKTDGGNCVVTLPAAGNQTGNNTITYGDVGDYVELVSVNHDGTLRWKIAVNSDAALSTV